MRARKILEDNMFKGNQIESLARKNNELEDALQ